jgi:regulatory protein
VVEETAVRLKESGLLDDAAFARSWRESRERHAPRSRFMIRQELAQRGVKGDAAEKAVEGLDEEAMARRVGEKFLRRLAGLDRRTFFNRMLGYLRRRGFNYRICADTTERLWRELSDPADGDVHCQRQQ